MIKDLIDMISNHDRVIIITENSKEPLNQLLKIIMNYIGKDNYIEHNDTIDFFENFVILNKQYNKRIISTSLNVGLSDTSVTDSNFDDIKFILPYKNINNTFGLPHFSVINKYSIPTKLLYKADLVIIINNNILTLEKVRNAAYFDRKINLKNLFTSERNIKIKKLKALI